MKKRETYPFRRLTDPRADAAVFSVFTTYSTSICTVLLYRDTSRSQYIYNDLTGLGKKKKKIQLPTNAKFDPF